MVFRAQSSAIFSIWLYSALILGAAGFAVTYFFSDLINIVLVIFVLFMLTLSFYLPFLIKHTYCKIEDGKVYSKLGFIFVRKTVLSTSNILYLSVCKTPLSRFTGLNFIVLNTFGAKTILPFLSEGDCKTISEMLK